MACASPPVDPLLSADRLVASLVDAVQTGDANLAKDLVAQISSSRLKLNIKVLKTQNSPQSLEKEFSVNVHIEDRHSNGTSFGLPVTSSNTVADLKEKIRLRHNIPTESQRWIIGKKIPEDDMTLGKCGVASTGHTLYLYVVTARLQKLEVNDSYGNVCPELVSPDRLSHILSYVGSAKESHFLLMNANINSNTLPCQTNKPTPPPRHPNAHTTPPPIPARSPLQDIWPDDSDSDSDQQTNVVFDPLMQVIPPPMQTRIESKPLGWECPKCTYLNLPTRPGCAMCTADRPEDYVVPDNYVMTDEEVAMMVHQVELEQQTRQPLTDESSTHNISGSQLSHDGRTPSAQEGVSLAVSGLSVNPHHSLYRMFAKENSGTNDNRNGGSSVSDNGCGSQNYAFLKNNSSSSSDCEDASFK